MRKLIIINLIELFVLVVFPELSVTTPPMFDLFDCWPFSSEPIHSFTYHQLDFSIQSESKEITKYKSVQLTFDCYEDDTKFDYSIVTSNDEKMLEIKGKNTDIVFLYDTKMQFCAKGNANVLYTIDFTRPPQATIFANRILRTTPSRYKNCRGSHTYKIDLLYDSTRNSSQPFDLFHMVENWCIFKERKDNSTTFMIKWIGPIAQHQDPIGVFRPTEYTLTRVPGADNKLKLSIFLDGQALGPKYILETSTPKKLEEFLK